MGIISLIIVGLIAGFLADYLYKSVQLGLLGKLVAGVTGAVVGGTLWHLLTTGDLDLVTAGSLDLGSIVIATIGAIITVYLYVKFNSRV